jgi:hypothetical protein
MLNNATTAPVTDFNEAMNWFIDNCQDLLRVAWVCKLSLVGILIISHTLL